MVGGPLFKLRIWGLVCPCMEKDEDKSARQSLAQLNQLGARVDWHTNPNSNSSRQGIINAATASGFVTNLFGSRGQSFSKNSNNQPSHQDNPTTSARLQVVDATKDSINWGEPYPELQLLPLPQQQQQQQSSSDPAAPIEEATLSKEGSSNPLGGGGLGLKRNSAMSYQLDIPLHHILKVESIDPNMLVIITKDVASTSDHTASTMGKESARVALASSDERDAVSLDIMVLVEWNKHRQPIIEEDVPVAVSLRQRAQKAAHFAKREIEMREKKRDREKRKANHMQGTAGLKYTAMAMANQQQR
jgi:hypothetical protein